MNVLERALLMTSEHSPHRIDVVFSRVLSVFCEDISAFAIIIPFFSGADSETMLMDKICEIFYPHA